MRKVALISFLLITFIQVFSGQGNALADSPEYKGDINGDASVDLEDAILGLQFLSGLNPPAIRADYASSGADVNNDHKIGSEEILHILQLLSGSRVQVWNLEVGPEGGTLIFGNGVRLEIPPGAVSEKTTISINDLPADHVTKMLSNPSMTSKHKKRFLGGFSAKPDGLVFAVPIQAWVPISPLNPYETPVQVELIMSAQRYRYASGQLEYFGDEAMVRVTSSHFSEKAFAGLTGKEIDALCSICGPFFYSFCEEFDPLQPACCLLYPKDRAECPKAAGCECCREKWVKVESTAVDFTALGECQVLGSDLKVTFPNCLGSPKETDSLSETSCKDLTLEIKVEPAEMTLSVGQEKELKATVIGKREGVTIFRDVPIDPIWTSDHPETVEIKADQSGKIIGKAISPSPVTIRAKISESSSVMEGTAQVTVNCDLCKVEVSPSSRTLEIGDSAPLEARLLDSLGNPVAIPTSSVIWASDSGIVSADPAIGLQTTVTANGPEPGLAAITATYTVDGVSGTASITVKQPLGVKDGFILRSPVKEEYQLGESVQLILRKTYSDDSVVIDSSVVWSSSQPLCTGPDVDDAAVVSSSGVVTFVGMGQNCVSVVDEGDDPDDWVPFGCSALVSCWPNWLYDCEIECHIHPQCGLVFSSGGDLCYGWATKADCRDMLENYIPYCKTKSN